MMQTSAPPTASSAEQQSILELISMRHEPKRQQRFSNAVSLGIELLTNTKFRDQFSVQQNKNRKLNIVRISARQWIEE
jgi:hypothetical protein